MKKALVYVTVILLFFAGGLYFSTEKSIEPKVTKKVKFALGTIIEFTIKDEEDSTADKAINEAYAEILRIDSIFTDYSEQSEIGKLNLEKPAFDTLSSEVYSLFVKSRELWLKTNGAFDITLGELVTLWGFKIKDAELVKEIVLPDKKEILDAVNRTGMSKIYLQAPDKIYLNGMKGQFDLGAIAKGYAVDKACEVLEKMGIKNYLVNAGGDVRGTGSEWVTGVQHPRQKDKLAVIVNINGSAIATSGDYEQFFEKDGVRYHHILNPKTGFPANDLMSVTVIAPDLTTADALATGFFVMGYKEAIKLADSLENVECYIIDASGQEHQSKGFYKYIRS